MSFSDSSRVNKGHVHKHLCCWKGWPKAKGLGPRGTHLVLQRLLLVHPLGLLDWPGISAAFPASLMRLHTWVEAIRNCILGIHDRTLTGLSTAGRQKLREELVKAKRLSLMRKKEHSWYGLRPSGIFELSSPWLTPAIHVFSTIPESEKRQHGKDQMLLFFLTQR